MCNMIIVWQLFDDVSYDVFSQPKRDFDGYIERNLFNWILHRIFQEVLRFLRDVFCFSSYDLIHLNLFVILVKSNQRRRRVNVRNLWYSHTFTSTSQDNRLDSNTSGNRSSDNG
jgi:hypothetical protein